MTSRPKWPKEGHPSSYTRFRQHLGRQPTRKCPNTEKIERDTIFTLQGGPSGRGTRFVDIKFKVPSQYKLLIQKATSNLKSTKGCPRPDGNPVEEGAQKFPTWEGETKPQPNVLQHGLIVGCKKGMKIAGRGMDDKELRKSQTAIELSIGSVSI